LIQRKAAAPRLPNSDAMTKPVPDKAEVALEYPDKFYIGTFERSARFEAHLDATGISLTLERTGDAETRKSVHMHINYGLFAEVLRDLAASVAARPIVSEHRASLAEAAKALHRALASKGGKRKPRTTEERTQCTAGS
jgi:hypothetical protein